MTATVDTAIPSSATPVSTASNTPATFLDLPDVTSDATKEFTLIGESHFLNKSLGSSGQLEIMTCDCRPNIKVQKNGTEKNLACDEHSDCINRLTSIECVNDHCGCGDNCQNQRFQRKEYAKLDVIRTEKKGYGIRAQQDIPADSFIIEYIGEVIDEGRFRKRMRQYVEIDKRQHFYFMMLRSGEFIDATVKGGFARFCNHSCSPNAYVDKWMVGSKLRMGIFAKRTITSGEEVTFDYNVDRYGSNPQSCYCGEPNCIGVLGGKTQTQSNRLPQSVIDALSLSDEDEERFFKASLAGTAKDSAGKKSKQLDESLLAQLPVKEIDPSEVSKLMAALVQSTESWLVKKLLQRIKCSQDKAVGLEVIRMHGYEIFSKLLVQYHDNSEFCLLIMEIMLQWPRLTKNKISSSKIESTVQSLSETSQSEKCRELARNLLQEWSNLEMAYRIPRRAKSEENDSKQASESPNDKNGKPSGDKNDKPSGDLSTGEALTETIKNLRSRLPQGPQHPTFRKPKERKLPKGWFKATAPDGSEYYYNREKNITTWKFPDEDSFKEDKSRVEEEKKASADLLAKNLQLQKIIEEANRLKSEQEQAELKLKAEEKARLEKRSARKEEKKRQQNKGGSSSHGSAKEHREKEDPAAHKLRKLLAGYVPNVVSRHNKELTRDEIKDVAKDIVNILVEKEIKRGNTDKLSDSLSDEKKKKIKVFTKDYVTRFQEKKLKRKRTNDDGEANGNGKKVSVSG